MTHRPRSAAFVAALTALTLTAAALTGCAGPSPLDQGGPGLADRCLEDLAWPLDTIRDNCTSSDGEKVGTQVAIAGGDLQLLLRCDGADGVLITNDKTPGTTALPGLAKGTKVDCPEGDKAKTMHLATVTDYVLAELTFIQQGTGTVSWGLIFERADGTHGTDGPDVADLTE